ncbi:MAG: biotin--[acetyl-CoA-carboxylase] ligase [Bacteroidales bacterium]|nr:biotin--[acetyl-CoA-carboxylase] ligase [Bacteroidales bacterium]
MPLKRIHLSSVDSTNRTLNDLLKSEVLKEEVVLIADYQENGRGQGNHHWHSNRGENLLMSVLLFPAFLSASSQFHLSRVTSLALCDTLKGLDLNPRIKWPNDILVNGKKIAGILIENGISGHNLVHSILGIGLNLNQQEFPEFPLPATSLALETGTRKDPGEAAELLLETIEVRYHQLETGSVAPLEEEYLAHLYNLDQPSGYIAEGIQFTGIIKGVNEFGELLVEIKGAIRPYGFQEIQYVVPGT